MKVRTCDKCKKEIPSREKYLKVVEQVWDNKMIKQMHAGDLCMDCWEQIKDDNKN